MISGELLWLKCGPAIGGVALVILALWPLLVGKVWSKRVPAPLVVLAVAVPLGFVFDLDPFRRQCLMEGLDEVGLTLARDTAISKFEGAMNEHRPWIEGRSGYASVAVESGGRT